MSECSRIYHNLYKSCVVTWIRLSVLSICLRQWCGQLYGRIQHQNSLSYPTWLGMMCSRAADANAYIFGVVINDDWLYKVLQLKMSKSRLDFCLVPSGVTVVGLVGSCVVTWIRLSGLSICLRQWCGQLYARIRHQNSLSYPTRLGMMCSSQWVCDN